MHTKYVDKNFFIHNILYIKFLKKILLRKKSSNFRYTF